jgi:uncharacterized protein YutE (UPF0331/DUF86 family)
MGEIPEQIRRRMVADDLRAKCEAILEQRVDRYMEIPHQPVTPNHHFAAASTQCIELYTDGYFISTVMVTQAVAEGIRKLVAERNGIKPDMQGDAVVRELLKAGLITQACAEAFDRIYGGFRNDVHHMNPKVSKIDFRALAKRNIQDLAVIEREIFACKITNEAFVPVNPKYWDIGPDGTMPVFLRCSP